jgi:hypothetical protein
MRIFLNILWNVGAEPANPRFYRKPDDGSVIQVENWVVDGFEIQVVSY